jgi:hypothetical protein
MANTKTFCNNNSLFELATKVYSDRMVYDLSTDLQQYVWIETVWMKLYDDQPTKAWTEFFVIQRYNNKFKYTVATFYEDFEDVPYNTYCVVDSPEGFQFRVRWEPEDWWD